MFHAETIKNILQDCAEPQIYERGLEYFYDGFVLQWEADNKSFAGFTKVTGRIEGRRIYQTTVKFFYSAKQRISSNCTCPYHDVCKHVVALGLAYADSLKNQKEPTEADRIRQALQSIGLSADKLPEGVINDLLRYKTADVSSAPAPAAAYKTPTPPATFDPKKYFIAIIEHNHYNPSLMELTEYSYKVPSSAKLLKQKGLTTEQRDLFNYLRDRGPNRYNTPPPDPTVLFPLLSASNIPVYDDFYTYRQKSLSIDLHPKPLSAEIVFKQTTDPWTNEGMDVFSLRMPEEYWKQRARQNNPFRLYNNCLVRKIGKTLELHVSTALLSGVIKRMAPSYADRYFTKPSNYYETELENNELVRYEALVNDASRCLSLSSPAPAFVTRAAPEAPHAALNVDFDNAAQTIRVAPIIDYGNFRQDVSENIFL